MRRSRKHRTKKIRKEKCIYTDEAKRIIKAIKTFKKMNKTFKSKK